MPTPKIYESFPQPRRRILADISSTMNRLLARDGTDDRRLQHLMIGTGELAHLNSVMHKREVLKRIAAHCVGWVESKVAKPKVFVEINFECVKRHQSFLDSEIAFDVANPNVGELPKLRELSKEVGHVAAAVDKLGLISQRYAVSGHRSHRLSLEERTRELCAELVQVAAVSVDWLQALDPVSAMKEVQS